MPTIIIGTILLAVCVFVGIFAVRAHKDAKEMKKRMKRAEDAVDDLLKSIKDLEEGIIEAAKTSAAKRAEAVFKDRGEELVSAQVADAMTREHKTLMSFLQEKLDKLQIVQTARIDNVTKAVDDTSNILTRMLRRLHLWPKESDSQPAPENSPQGE